MPTCNILQLIQRGYKNIDAVDAAEGMLKVAEEKNIYGKIVCQFIGNEKLPFDDSKQFVYTLME